MNSIKIFLLLLCAACFQVSQVNAQTSPLLQKEIRLVSGSNFLTLKAPTLSNNATVFTFPSSNGASGNVLVTDGSGNLSWAAPGGAGWALSGNSGLTSSGNLGAAPTASFFGNTDAVSLRFVTDNKVRMIIDNNGDISLGGAFSVTGNATLGGTLGVTGATTLGGATTVNNTFGVGNFATSLGGTLGVTGATTLSSTLGVTGAVTLTDLAGATPNSTVPTGYDRIVLANNSGQLEEASITAVISSAVGGSGWTLSGNTLGANSGNIGAAPTGRFLGATDNNDVRFVSNNLVRMILKANGDVETGNLAIGGTLGVTGATTLSGATTISNTLSVGNFATTLGGSLAVTGNTTLSGTLGVTGLGSFNAGLNLAGTTSPLQVNGIAGTTGQVLLSAGSGNTPTWGTIVKTKGVQTVSGVESIEITGIAGLDANDGISLTLEGTGAGMAIPSYYVVRDIANTKITVYFSAAFTGSITYAVFE